MNVRVATESDFDGITATLVGAFEHDPLWRWAYPDFDDLEACWRIYVRAGLLHPWMLVAGDYDAVAVWTPPGEPELPPELEAEMETLIEERAGPRAAAIMQLLERFEAAHPRDTPHFYLGLLGTHPDRRGRGLGMALLAESLRRIDSEGIPTYLESSNPANDDRYAGVGFRRVGEFTTPDGAHVVGTMWRDAS
jgi:GNAT superfamily N-acetyltransferase